MSAGRITVVPGNASVTLVLAQWALSRDAVLGNDEARELIRRIEAALAAQGNRLPNVL